MKFIIGLGENKNILEAVKLFKNKYNVEIEITKNETELLNGILDKNVDAVIRGSLPAKNLINELKNNYPHSNINRCTYIKNNDKEFLISPVGIDEGLNPEQRIELAKDCVNFTLKLGKTPKIGVLGNGRKDDYNRNNPEVDKSLKESEEITRELKKLYPEYLIKDYYILIEKAINENCNIILAPDGVIGNILFRSLVLVSKWESMGAITLGIPEIYIDTSRDQSINGYYRALNLAYSLTKQKKQIKY